MNHILQNVHLPWEIMPTYMFNNYGEVFSTWKASFGWKQSEEDAPHMPALSSISAMTRSYIGSYINTN